MLAFRRFAEAQRRHDSREEPGHPRYECTEHTCGCVRGDGPRGCRRCKGRGFVVRYREVPAEAGEEAT